MKKKCLFLLLVPFAFSSLVSCSSKQKECLTFGTYVYQTVQTLKPLSNVELVEKTNGNEIFLLAAYQGQYSETCSCWTTYQNIIASYMNKYSERVYVYNAQEQDATTEHLKITKVEASTPYLYIFKGSRQIAKFSKSKSKDEAIFTDETGETMAERVHKVVSKPKMYYVDDAYLKENLSKTSKAIVSFIRNKCDDCKYVIPNVIIPYIKDKVFYTNIWLFDMQDVYELSNSSTASSEEKEQYQNIKNAYGLSASSNETFGYQQGVVPTTQFYEDGILKDASVFFNDTIEQKEDGTYYVKESYYSEERVQNLSYLKNASVNKVIEGKTIDASKVMHTTSGKPYWSQKDAAILHAPLLTAFLDYYI